MASNSEWSQIVEVFHAAREKSGGERVVLLDTACEGNTLLRKAVEELLKEHDSADGFLSEPLLNSVTGEPLSTGITPGQQFEQYVTVALLGRGGMGEVWWARDTELDRPVALKFLCSECISGLEAEQLTREAKAASALNHPNIVTIHEVVHSESRLAIAMELVEGNSLGQLRGTPLPTAELLAIGLQIAEALAAAHGRGIIHGDIKPENILLRQDRYVKVLDFGLARTVTAEATALSECPALGTLRYMSPEQAREDPLTPASDVFSFGLVLYELATGQHAFPGHSPAETAHAIRLEDPLPPSSVNHSIPPNLDSLILAMLAKDPGVRPSAEEVKRKLREILLLSERPTPAAVSYGRKLARDRFWLASLIFSFIVLGAIGWFVYSRRTTPEFAELKIQPLTSQAGWEGSPALSPDGQSMAFTWTEKLDRPKQIYVKQLNDSEPVKLTDSDSEGTIGSLVWSPDGRRVAFKREYRESGAIFAIPSSGGLEKKLLDVENPHSGLAIDWSPDGAQLAFPEKMPGLDHVAIYLFNIGTGEKRKLTSPPIEDTGDYDPKFSPDGRTVAFKRVTGFWADDIYVVPTTGGPVRRVTAEKRGIWGHAWSADGRSLIVSCQRGGTIFGLWRFPLNSQLRPERIVQGGIDAITPTTGRRTSRVAWVNQLQDLNIYRVSASGTGVPEKLIASTLRDQGATYSPDGRIAFVSDRSGSREIWMARADGSSQVRLTNFKGPDVGDLQWSPDGHHLAFYGRVYGRSDIFSLDYDPATKRCGNPKRLISGIKAEVPSWSADGKFLYFASDRTGRWEVWKQPAFGGQALQVTHHGGYAAHESRDGKWLYFSKDRGDRIWRIPSAQFGGQPGSSEEMLIGRPNDVQQKGWTVTGDEIVFIDLGTSGRPAAIRAYRISTKGTRLISTLAESFTDGRDYAVSVSPDSQWVLYSQLDRSGSNVMVAENIR